MQLKQTDSTASRWWRRAAGSAVRRLGFALGIAIALLYEVLMCNAPAPDWAQMHLRTFVNGYVIAPIVIFCGSVWLCGWIAVRVDPDRPPE